MPDVPREMARQYRLGASLRALGRQYGIDMNTVAARIRPYVPQAVFDIRKRGAGHPFYRGATRINRFTLRKQVERAVEAGALIRPEQCEDCSRFAGVDPIGRSLLVAHHDDYRKPMVVRWLCRACHFAWHKTHKAKS